MTASLCAFLIAIAVITRTLDGRAREQTEHAARVLSSSGLPLTHDLLGRLSLLQRADFYVLDETGNVVLSSVEPVPQGLSRQLAASRGSRGGVRFDLDG